MTTPLDISDFVYNTGTLTIAPGDTTAVFAGTSLSANIKNGDTLCAGGVKVPIKTVTDDTHAELFTAWDGASVTGGTYVILKDSMLRDNAVQIGYDTAAFLSFLDNTTIWYVVEGAAPDPSVGEDGNRALKTNVTPWQQWLKTGGVWVLQAGSPGGPGATILVQNAEPDTSHPDNSLWVDSDSADLDVYVLTGSPPAWADTGMNLKGVTGPASLKPIEAWVTATTYVTGPPASFVSQSGSAYECLIAHTSGTFNTDLAAGKWGLVAAKGADGTGVGDMVGPASAVDSNIALFDGASGKLLKDGLVAISSFATAAQGAKADSAVQDVAAVTHAATGKTTPVDADEFGIVDSAASNVLKKLTWANLKAALPGGMTDEQRRNDLVDKIYQSKSLAVYRRGLNVFADGYKATGGVNSGSSLNYSIDTAGGKISPTTAADTYTTYVDPILTSDVADGLAYGVRQQVAKAAYGSTVDGNKIRITLTPPSTGTAVGISSVWVGHAGVAPNFDGNQVQVTFGGNASPGLVTGGSSVVSDAVTFAFDHTKDLIVSFNITSFSVRRGSSATNYTRHILANDGANVSSTTVSGYTATASTIDLLDKVEVRTAIGAPNNMTVVTTSQTADVSVSNGRVLIEYDNSAAPTLNTDLTVEVTCNGGTNWTAATLSSIGTGQSGRKIAETSDQSCTAGTSFAARIKTANNKSVSVYGVSLTVH